MNNKNKDYGTTVYVGTVNGKAKRKHIRAGSERELKKKIAEIKADVAAGKDVYTRAVFGVWANKWINEMIIPSGISNGTITQYKAAVKHLKRRFSDVEFKYITFSEFQQFINDLAAENPNTHKPTAKATLESVKKVAAAVFRYACSNNIAGVPDYFRDVKIPKTAPKKERRALTEQEQQWIINTPHRAQPAAMIMLFAGLRRGELIPLQWSDVDLTVGTISVNKSVEFINKKAHIKAGGKSAAAYRVIPIPPNLIDYLRQYQRNSKIISMYVCVNAGGKMHTESSFKKMWESYLLDLNVKYGYENNDVSKYDPKGLPMRIERITPHYLRHTYATLLYLQGVDLETAKQYLGHSDIQVTSNIYTDLKNNQRFNLSESYKALLQNEYKIKRA